MQLKPVRMPAAIVQVRANDDDDLTHNIFKGDDMHSSSQPSTLHLQCNCMSRKVQILENDAFGSLPVPKRKLKAPTKPGQMPHETR